MRSILKSATLATLLVAAPTYSAVIYNNLTPNNSIAIATRPGATSFEIEAADDFIVGGPATVNSGSFIGLLVATGAAPPTITNVDVEIYQVFPLSSAPPSGKVTTRVNSPSDVAFASRDAATANLSFTTQTLAPSFMALNSIQPGGIHPLPGETTGGNGPVTGAEVQFNVTFLTPFSLPADHYFFVPQVEVSGGVFYWLSASRPISGSGTTNIAPDLQAWTRDAALDPDWLRVGTDIVGPPVTGGAAPQFNTAFSLDGTVAPEPGAWILVTAGLGLVLLSRLRGLRD